MKVLSAVCEAHLDSLEEELPDRAEIENQLVSSTVLTIVSNYEEYIERRFVERAAMSGDPHVTSYVQSQIASSFRSPDLGKITKTLGQFGGDYQERFTRRVENTEAHACWDNIMRARHAIVHKRGFMNLTFRELKTSYTKSHEILKALIETLGLAESL